MNNQITLAGYVGKDPEERLFDETEKKLARFSLAVKQFAKGQEETMWIDCEAWNGNSDKVMDLIKGGREVVVYGSLAITRFQMKDGTQVSKPVIKVSGFYLCGSAKTKSANGQKQVSGNNS